MLNRFKLLTINKKSENMTEQKSTISSKNEKYEIKEKLGSGGFGTTYLATGLSNNADVVIKTLNLSKLEDWKALDLFEREIKILKNLSHPHIPKYLDSFEIENEGFVLVQEYIAGTSLQQIIESKKKLSEPEIINWLTQILDVCVYLHNLHPPVIHRDITPKNILLNKEEKAYLIDFGTVQDVLNSSQAGNTMAGTFGYAPLEQFVGKALPASDLYGLGMTCLAVASGLDPSNMTFNGNKVNVKKVAHFDARLNLLIQEITEPNIENRLDSAKKAIEKLKPIIKQDENKSIPVYEYTKMKKEREKHKKVNEKNLWSIPFKDMEFRNIEISSCLSSEGNVLSIGNMLIDTQNMKLIEILTIKPYPLQIVALTPRADFVVAINSIDKIFGYANTKEGYEKVCEIENNLYNNFEKIKISPNGKLLLIENEQKLFLVDFKNGTLLQTIEFERSAHCITFNADGSGIAYSVEDYTYLLNLSGENQKLKKVDGIVFSPDGKKVALFEQEFFEIGLMENLNSKKDFVRIKNFKGGYFPTGNFSPNGKYFVFFDDDNYEIIIIDVVSGKIINTLREPIDNNKVDIPYLLGNNKVLSFSADSSEILCVCRSRVNKYVKQDEFSSCLIWRVEDGQFLGAIVAGTLKNELWAISETGFYSPISKKDVNKNKKSFIKSFFSKKYRNQVNDMWYHPKLTLNSLKGEPVEFLLNEEEKIQLLDLEERWDFYNELMKTNQLADDINILELVEISKGFSHLLKTILYFAKKIQKEKITFGQTGEIKLTGSLILQAIDKIESKTNEELAVLYEEVEHMK